MRRGRASWRKTPGEAAPAQQRQRPEKEKMAAAARANQRRAPARARPLPSPGAPRAPDGSIRRNHPLPAPALVTPGRYKAERGARVLLSAGGRGRGVVAVLVVSVWRGSGGGRACRTVTAQPLGARVPIPCEGRRCPPARTRAASTPPRDAGSARPASPHPRAGRSMSAASDTYFLIKDIKPGLKNLNVIFIVLEIGKWRPARPTPGPPTRVTAGGGAGGAVPPPEPRFSPQGESPRRRTGTR